MMVTLYSQPNCAPCRMTKMILERDGIEYRELDVTTDPEAYQFVKDLGYKQVPVVVAGDRHWSGLNPPELAALADRVSA